MLHEPLPDHLDYHGTIDEYFEAKAALFTPERVGVAVVNVDDRYGRELGGARGLLDLPLVTFGIDARDADVVATGLGRADNGARVRLTAHRDWSSDLVVARSAASTPPRSVLTSSSRSRVGSTSATRSPRPRPRSPAACRSTRSSPGCRRRSPVPGRMERVDAGQPFTVLVDYAHTPDALDAVLGAARELAGPGTA